MKGKFGIIVFLMLLIPIFQSLIVMGPITGSVTSFDDSEPSKIAEITKTESIVNVGNITIPKRAIITKASMNVSMVTSPTEEYPKDVFVDLGDDGQFEWGFSGQGYGQVGQQRYFMDNKSYSRLKITNDSYNNTASIRLPKNATVDSTMMLIDGRANVSGAEPSQNWNLINSQSSVKVVANITGGKVYFVRIVGTANYFDIYDPSSKSWSTSSYCNTNLATTGHAITLAGTDIYITTTNNKLYRYHTNNDTWIDLGGVPSSATMITYGGLTYDHADRMYAIQYNYGPSTSIAFYYYAISNGTWIKLKSPFQVDCAYPTLCYLENRVYLMNRTYYLASQTKCKGIQFYAPNNNTWFRLSSAPIQIATRLCTDKHNLFGATNEGQILKYDVLSDTWAITGKTTSNFINIVGGLAYSDRMFYLCRYNPSSGYYNITAVGGGDFPVNSTLDIGDNGGLPEWDINGEFNTTDYVSDFTSELNSLITSTPTSYIDAYGNEFVDIAVNVTSNVTSLFTIRDMKINYSYTEVIDFNPFSGNLLNALNDLVPDTGEGDITIPIIIYGSTPGKINISNIIIDYFIPDLTNNRLELITGHDPMGKTIYADYMDYTFLVNITNRWGYTDVKDVILYLDLDGENLQLIWDEASDTFAELSDPKNLITLSPGSCTSTHNSVENWTLTFVVRFDWAYPNETLELCALKTTNDSLVSVFNEFLDVYRVENDLEFVGNLEVTATKQGSLSTKPANEHWVDGAETITWSNLTVVYEGTTDFYPENKNFDVTIFDDDTGSWMNTSSSGQSFVLQTVSDATSDYDDLHTVNITNIPGTGEDVSNISFLIRTDNTGPTPPVNFICHADSPFDSETVYDDDTVIFVTWNDATDAGAGVQYYAMEFNNPTPTIQNTSESSVNGTEGLSRFYVRARDNVGNWGTSASATIFIDLTNLTFTDPQPSPESWQTQLTVTCSVTILDSAGSGVDINSVQYRYVDEGDIELADWQNYNGPGASGETVVCVQNITFDGDGVDKKVQWRARDLAGNGRVVMETPHLLKIDSIIPTLNYDDPDLSKWLNTKNPKIKFYINDTSGSGIELSSLQYSVSTTGPDNFGPWKALNGVGGGESVYCTIDETFVEGKLNYIKVQASDIAGNIKTFEPKLVLIDSSVPEFSDPIPSADAWTNSEDVLCNITIHDKISSIDTTKIMYQSSTNGIENYDYWKFVKSDSITAAPDGQTFEIAVSVKFKDGQLNYLRWSAVDLGGNEVSSDHYKVQVDIVPIKLQSAFPGETDWYNSIHVPCSIILDDTNGSGVVGSTVEYSISKSGLSGFSGWTNKGLELSAQSTSRSSRRAGDSDNIYTIALATVTPTFAAGASNYIKWRANDVAGNIITSGGYQVNVDLDEVFFLNPEPREEVTYDELELRCKITIVDIGGSGVNPEKVEYRYSNTGPSGFKEWSTEDITPDKVDDKLLFFIDLPFYTGDQNRLQWRAMDNAGNGPTESKIFNITINSPPTVIIDQPKALGKYNSDDNIFFSANSTFDPDPDDKLTYDWSSNISKFLGDTKTFYHKLPAGVHNIVLRVSDNHGHTVSGSRVITISKYYVDTDNDGTPDYLDSDDDNDKIPDINDAFPLDPNEWKDTDRDGIGNNADFDDDGDNYPDSEDAYPEDPDKWEKEKDTGLEMMQTTIILIIFIIILICVAAAVMYQRGKKRAKRAAEEELATSKLPAPTTGAHILGGTRIHDVEVEMVGGVGAQGRLTHGSETTQTTPLLTGSVQPTYPTGASPTQPAESPQVIPQHLVRSPEREIPAHSVQSYIPQPDKPSPAQPTPGTTIIDQPAETEPQPQQTAAPESVPPAQQPPTEEVPKKISKIPGLTPDQQKAKSNNQTKEDETYEEDLQKDKPLEEEL